MEEYLVACASRGTHSFERFERKGEGLRSYKDLSLAAQPVLTQEFVFSDTDVQMRPALC